MRMTKKQSFSSVQENDSVRPGRSKAPKRNDSPSNTKNEFERSKLKRIASNTYNNKEDEELKYKKDYVQKNLLDEFEKNENVSPLALVKSESV